MMKGIGKIKNKKRGYRNIRIPGYQNIRIPEKILKISIDALISRYPNFLQ
jgi:hypothetical protein